MSERQEPHWSCELLQEWFSGSHGQSLLDKELSLLGEFLPALPGRQIVQFGVPVVADLMAASRCRAKLSLSACGQAHEALPLSSATADVLLLPHTLEFTTHPKWLLSEARRVLVEGGHLLLLFFNARPPQNLGVPLGGGKGEGHGASSEPGAAGAAQAEVCRLLAGQELEIQARRDLYCFSLPGAPRCRWWTSRTMGWGRFLPGTVCVLLCKKQGIPLIPLRDRWARQMPDAGGARKPLRVDPGVTRASRTGVALRA